MSGAQSGRTIVPCIHCGTRMNLPVEREGTVKCPVCGGERWASTVDDRPQTAQSPARHSGLRSPSVATILSVPVFMVSAGLGAALGWLMSGVYLFSISFAIGPAQNYLSPSILDRTYHVLSLALRQFLPAVIVGSAAVMIAYSITSYFLPAAKVKAVAIATIAIASAYVSIPYLVWMNDPIFRETVNLITQSGFVFGLVAGLFLAFEKE